MNKLFNGNQIPKHWQIVDLKNITESIQYGYTESSSKEKIGPKFLRITDIQDDKVQWDDVPYCKIENAIKSKYLLKDGDLVFARTGATVGKSFLIKGHIPEAVFASYLIRVRVNQNISEKYLSYFFHSPNYWNQITDGQVGIGQPNVNGTKLSQLKIPIAPIEEQQAIASKIEELLSDLENGKQQLQTAQQQLKIYRQSLLKWAFEGKLSLNYDSCDLYDENDLKEKKQQVNQNHINHNNQTNHRSDNLPKGWKWVPLGEACYKIQDGSHFSPQIQYDEPGENRFMYITAKNIRNDYMDLSKLIYVDKDFHDSIYSRCNPEFGDVLLTKDGVNTGEVTLNTLHEPFSLLSSVCIFKTKKDELVNSYLKYFIQSPFGNKAILDSMTGTAIKRIVLRKIKDAKIILPTLAEQHLIVSELESKLTVCDKIEETISQSLQQAETLRQSILKKAFEGKLV